MGLSTATFWNLAGKPPLTLRAGTLEAGATTFPIDVEGRAFLWWYPPAAGQASAFPQYPAAEVLKAAVQMELGRLPTLSPSLFSNKVVFIGASAPGLFDIKTTPLIRTRVVDGRETRTTATPGVEVQATALANLLRNDLVRRIPFWVVLAGIAAICLGVGVAARGMRHAALGLSVAIGILLASSAAAYGSLRAGHCLFDVVPLWFAALGTFLECTFINYLWERRHARVVRGIFEHYLDSSVVRTLINNPERVRLGGELRNCTVLFSDVANFTHTSERMSPEQLVHFMNIYLDAMTDVIVQSGGFVDKFVGDEIVAIFGAPNDLPDHPVRACAAIARMCKKVEELQESFRSMGCVPPVFARTGISTGPMVVGNMGSENRMNYTAMGDVMNLGARLEGVNKVYGTRVIVSEPTRQAAGDQFAFRELDSIKVKGKDKGTPIHEFLGMAGEVSDAVSKRVGRYTAGLALYRERRWTEAHACFEEAAALGDEPARMMSGRCLEYAKQPPPIEWDGSYTMLSK
jgi:adenylate cyclase